MIVATEWERKARGRLLAGDEAAMAYREVARLLDIPEGTAKSRMRLGLRHVAVALQESGVEGWT